MAKEVTAKPRNDAYTGLLAVSFLALVGATVLMALDAQELGTAPSPLKVDVPGANLGKGGEPLKKADPGKIDNAPAPMPPMGMGGMMMRNDPPAKLPELPIVEVPPVVIPASATAVDTKPTTTKVVDPDAPPLVVKPFIPPM